MNYIIAIDIGGTKIITCLIKNDKILKQIKFKTKKGRNNIIRSIESSVYLITSNIKLSDVKNIVVGVASPVNEERGIIINAPNIRGFRNLNIKKILENKLKIPVIVKNDACLQALGEYSINQDIKSLFLLTLGTGVGASFVYKGKVFPLEFGHTIIQANGNKCSCGNKGCIESYVSGHAISNLFFKRYKKRLLPSQILELAKKHDKNAKRFLEETGRYLGIGLVNIINTFNPEAIIINGGLTPIVEYLMPSIKKQIKKNKTIKFVGNIMISSLKENALFYGVTYLLPMD
ncbi:MAG: ROK family protein [Nanoarchaeota archaeon]